MPPPCTGNDLLLVTNSKEGAELERLFRESGMNVFVAANCQQARQRLGSGHDPQIVVTALSLPDGSWWTLRKALIDRGSTAALIVCMPVVDGGVTDVLEAGCTAVLVPPYGLERVRTIIEATKARRIPPKAMRKVPRSSKTSASSEPTRWHVA